MEYFIEFLKNDFTSVNREDSCSTDIEDSIESHLMAFAAEEARKNKEVIHLSKWRNSLL